MEENEHHMDEEEEDGLHPSPTCYRCKAPRSGVNRFVLEGEVLEGGIDGELCPQCARAVLATLNAGAEPRSH